MRMNNPFLPSDPFRELNEMLAHLQRLAERAESDGKYFKELFIGFDGRMYTAEFIPTYTTETKPFTAPKIEVKPKQSDKSHEPSEKNRLMLSIVSSKDKKLYRENKKKFTKEERKYLEDRLSKP